MTFEQGGKDFTGGDKQVGLAVTEKFGFRIGGCAEGDQEASSREMFSRVNREPISLEMIRRRKNRKKTRIRSRNGNWNKREVTATDGDLVFGA
jgi:hypothetical protein